MSSQINANLTTELSSQLEEAVKASRFNMSSYVTESLRAHMAVNNAFAQTNRIKEISENIRKAYAIQPIAMSFKVSTEFANQFRDYAEQHKRAFSGFSGVAIQEAIASANLASSLKIDALFSEPESHEVFVPDEIGEQSELIITSPSIKVLRAIQDQKLTVGELTWRQFEELVAQLLDDEGYEVTIGRGTKDGGVDIFATKFAPGIGDISSVWQAKHYRSSKVGIDAVRELADTRNEMKASKGVMVTSSYLTQGALERVERDRYILAKVEKDELETWLRRQ